MSYWLIQSHVSHLSHTVKPNSFFNKLAFWSAIIIYPYYSFSWIVWRCSSLYLHGAHLVCRRKVYKEAAPVVDALGVWSQVCETQSNYLLGGTARRKNSQKTSVMKWVPLLTRHGVNECRYKTMWQHPFTYMVESSTELSLENLSNTENIN